MWLLGVRWSRTPLPGCWARPEAISGPVCSERGQGSGTHRTPLPAGFRGRCNSGFRRKCSLCHQGPGLPVGAKLLGEGSCRHYPAGQAPRDAHAGWSGQAPRDAHAGWSGEAARGAHAGWSGQAPRDAHAGWSGEAPRDAHAGWSGQAPRDAHAGWSGEAPRGAHAGWSGEAARGVHLAHAVVCELDVPVRIQEDIVQLQVPVDDPPLVQEVEGDADLGRVEPGGGDAVMGAVPVPEAAPTAPAWGPHTPVCPTTGPASSQ